MVRWRGDARVRGAGGEGEHNYLGRVGMGAVRTGRVGDVPGSICCISPRLCTRSRSPCVLRGENGGQRLGRDGRSCRSTASCSESGCNKLFGRVAFALTCARSSANATGPDPESISGPPYGGCDRAAPSPQTLPQCTPTSSPASHPSCGLDFGRRPEHTRRKVFGFPRHSRCARWTKRLGRMRR